MGGGYRTGGPDRSDEYEDRRPPREDRADAIQAVQEAAAAAQAAMNRRDGDDETDGTDTESPGATSVREIDGIGKTKGSALAEAGYQTVADLRSASREQLLAVSGIGPQTADRIQSAVSEPGSADLGLTEDVEQAIDETPIVETAPAAVDDLRTLFRSSAREFASQIKDPVIAQHMFDHLTELRQNNQEGPAAAVTAGTEAAGTRLTLTADSIRTDAIHEYAHVFADAYGYTDGQLGENAARTYRLTHRDPNGPNDPFVSIDPDEPECQLSQEHGGVVEDTPQEVQQFMDAVNAAWSQLQRRGQAGEVPQQYTVLDNYSATTASEFLARLNEFMQSETVSEESTEFIRNQPEVIRAYREVFEVSDAVQAILDKGSE